MKKIVVLFIVSAFIISSCRLVSTVISNPTAVPVEPTSPATLSPTTTSTPESVSPFAVLSGAPLFSPAFLHADPPCAWMGAAGQVFSTDGKPLSGLIVHVIGSAGESAVDVIAYTGAETGYGPGGFELKLSDQALPGAFWIQVLDVEGNLLTEPFYFEMSGNCEENLAVINFAQVRGD